MVEVEPTAEELEAELAELEKTELDAPQVEAPHKRQVNCVHCGKPYTEHAKNSKTPDDSLACKGIRKGFTPPAAAE